MLKPAGAIFRNVKGILHGWNLPEKERVDKRGNLKQRQIIKE
jgi:hypothetical protein